MSANGSFSVPTLLVIIFLIAVGALLVGLIASSILAPEKIDQLKKNIDTVIQPIVSDQNAVVPLTPVCGNTVCESNETVDNCLLDCFACNHNGVCESEIGENGYSCEADCVSLCNSDGQCDFSETVFSCPLDCDANNGDGSGSSGPGDNENPPVFSSCGNGSCQSDESCASCPADCGSCGTSSTACTSAGGVCQVQSCENGFESFVPGNIQCPAQSQCCKPSSSDPPILQTGFFLDDYSSLAFVESASLQQVNWSAGKMQAMAGSSGGEIDPTSNGLVFLLKMNGDFSDVGPSSLNGSLSGTGIDCTVLGKVDQGCAFFGTGYLDFSDPDLFENLNQFSVAFWAKSDEPLVDSGSRMIVSQEGSGRDVFTFKRLQGDYVQFGVSKSTGASTWTEVIARQDGILSDSNWHHFAGVLNGTSVLLFVDGVLQSNQPVFSGVTDASANPFRIGANENGWIGKMDELGIWNRALTQMEISSLAVESQNPSVGSFRSIDINMGSLRNQLRVVWAEEVANTVLVKISSSNGSSWCAVSNGEPLDENTCAELPAAHLVYEATLLNGAVLDSIRLDWNGVASSLPSAVCGNNIREGTEVCDGTDLNGQTCQSQGFFGGSLLCAASCMELDVSACTGEPIIVPLCGNGVIESGESCDDKNKVPLDGCSTSCVIESGWTCSGQPSQCLQGSWKPPIGIPVPSFGIVESHFLYAGKRFDFNGNGVLEPGEEYRDAGNGPFSHYVNPSYSGCTNNANPFGSVEKPRCSFPSSLPEGSVVELHGTYPKKQSVLVANGSAQKPVFVRGPSVSQKSKLLSEVIVKGQYVILENLSTETVSFRPHNGSLLHHAAFRFSEIAGDGTVTGFQGTVAIGGDQNRVFHDLVVYQTDIHDNGDRFSSDEKDRHGVSVGAFAENVWILDNRIYRNGGDSIQVNSGGTISTRRVYIGRNEMHEDRENAVDIKKSEDVIISQNKMWGYFPSSTSNGTVTVAHYDPKRIWYLYNEISKGQFGIVSTGTYDLYLIGNVIFDIQNHESDGHPNSSPHRNGSAIYWYNTGKVFVFNNSLFNVGRGLGADLLSYSPMIVNNIFGDLMKDQNDFHLVLAGSGMSDAVISNNLFYQSNGAAAVYWKTPLSIAAFKSQTGKCAGCIESNPLFANPSTFNLRLKQGSPAINVGITPSFLSTFSALYGLDISKDFDNNERPVGTKWDLGSFEYK